MNTVLVSRNIQSIEKNGYLIKKLNIQDWFRMFGIGFVQKLKKKIFLQIVVL